jgi:hypothetical protein
MKIQFTINVPRWLEAAIVWIVLTYRRLRYGEAFRLIPLTKGLFAIVSPEDYDRLAAYKWHSARHGRTIYAQTGTGSAKAGKRKRHLMMMHRIVMSVEDERFVDHQNHNGLDNRRSNLRIATWEENCWNKRKRNTKSSSIYKGIMWDKRRNTWQAMIGYKGKKIFIGYFADEQEAARAYDAKAKELYGQFAALNFPENQTDPLAEWTNRICYGKYTG